MRRFPWAGTQAPTGLGGPNASDTGKRRRREILLPPQRNLSPFAGTRAKFQEKEKQNANYLDRTPILRRAGW